TFQLVPLLIRRIDQNEAAPFGGRDKSPQGHIAIHRKSLCARIVANIGLEACKSARMQFAEEHAVLAPQQGLRDRGRTGIARRLLPCEWRGNLQIWQGGGGRVLCGTGCEQSAYSALPFGRLLRFRAGQAISTAPGMGVDKAECGLLCAKTQQYAGENDV